MQSSTLQKALDTVEGLSLEDQELLIELVGRRLTERRRIEISRNATDTLEAVRSGRASIGTLKDIQNDLADDA